MPKIVKINEIRSPEVDIEYKWKRMQSESINRGNKID